MNTKIFLLNKLQKKTKLTYLFKLNLLNTSYVGFNKLVFIFFVNLFKEDKFFVGNFCLNSIEHNLIFNKNDLSLLTFYIYSPYIFCVLCF